MHKKSVLIIKRTSVAWIDGQRITVHIVSGRKASDVKVEPGIS